MELRTANERPASVRHEIAYDGDDTIVLLVRLPTMADRLAVQGMLHAGQVSGTLAEMQTAVAEYRLGLITDWEGVTLPNGLPAKFTRDAFEMACNQHPAILYGALRFVTDLFLGLADIEEAKKKPDASGDPPSES